MKKILISGVFILALLCLAGCGSNTAKEAAESELTNETSSPAGNTESALETEAATDMSDTEIITSAKADIEESSLEAESVKNDISEAEPVKQENSEVEPVKNETQVEQTQPEEAAQTQVTEVTEVTPTEATTEQTQTTQEQTEAFDVAPYVEYAKSYAQSIGLELDSTATACWDNPIAANAKLTNIKENIRGRLEDYKYNEGFTGVWVWSEKSSDNGYEIYIGYY